VFIKTNINAVLGIQTNVEVLDSTTYSGR